MGSRKRFAAHDVLYRFAGVKLIWCSPYAWTWKRDCLLIFSAWTEYYDSDKETEDDWPDAPVTMSAAHLPGTTCLVTFRKAARWTDRRISCLQAECEQYKDGLIHGLRIRNAMIQSGPDNAFRGCLDLAE